MNENEALVWASEPSSSGHHINASFPFPQPTTNNQYPITTTNNDHYYLSRQSQAANTNNTSTMAAEPTHQRQIA